MSQDIAYRSPAVLHLISSLEVGGAERLLIDLVRSCNEGVEPPQVVVVMNNRVDRQMVAELNATSVPAYYLGRPEGSKNPKYIDDLSKIIRTHHVGVIHSHTTGAKYWSALCRITNRDLKLVHTFHDTRIALNSVEVRLHNLMIRVTIAISRAVAEEAHSLKIKRVEQIGNGVPTSHFRKEPAQPSSSSRARIICVGRLLPEKKGQDILIRAIDRCVDSGLDVECTFVGNPATGDLYTVSMLKGLITTLGLSDRVHFVRGRTDVAKLLADADIFVLPSRWEGFGLALVEAMAAGLPVIASNIDGPAEIITDGVDGLLFESGSDEALAERIATLIQSPKLADKLRHNGMLRSADYDISIMRDKYLAAYRRLIIVK